MLTQSIEKKLPAEPPIKTCFLVVGPRVSKKNSAKEFSNVKEALDNQGLTVFQFGDGEQCWDDTLSQEFFQKVEESKGHCMLYVDARGFLKENTHRLKLAAERLIKTIDFMEEVATRLKGHPIDVIISSSGAKHSLSSIISVLPKGSSYLAFDNHAPPSCLDNPNLQLTCLMIGLKCYSLLKEKINAENFLLAYFIYSDYIFLKETLAPEESLTERIKKYRARGFSSAEISKMFEYVENILNISYIKWFSEWFKEGFHDTFPTSKHKDKRTYLMMAICYVIDKVGIYEHTLLPPQGLLQETQPHMLTPPLDDSEDQKQEDFQEENISPQIVSDFKSALDKASSATTDPKKKAIIQYLKQASDEIKIKKDFGKLLLTAERTLSHHTNWFKGRSSASFTRAYSASKEDLLKIRDQLSGLYSLDNVLKRKPPALSEVREFYTYRFFCKHLDKKNEMRPQLDAEFKKIFSKE